MFDILVFLYETYQHPDICKDAEKVAKALSEEGFHQSEISDALDWLSQLPISSSSFATHNPAHTNTSWRIYVGRERAQLGDETIQFIQQLELTQVITPFQREIIIERAMAINVGPITPDQLRIVILMLLWSQGDSAKRVLDALFPLSHTETTLLH